MLRIGAAMSAGEAGRRHLIEQRLEQVIVLAVDDDDLDRGVGERLGRP
jgi:hypothetical protein